MNARSAAHDALVASPTDSLLARYIDVLAAEKNLSPFTRRNYANDLRHLFGYLDVQRIEALSLTRLAFRGYLASMIDAGVAQGSIVRRVSTARSFYRWLRLSGVMTDDPLANVRGPKQARRLPHAMTLAHITDLIAAADGDKPADLRDRALLEVMYASGLRVSEASTLDVQHVDLAQMTLLVRGKGNKERLVVIGEPARAALKRYLAAAGRARLLRNHRSTGEPSGKDGAGPNVATPSSARSPMPIQQSATRALFLNRNGARMSQRRIQLLVKKYALKAGIDERVHPHLLRHTFATHLLDGGAELRVVQELMGHSSPNTTQIYLHVTEERQRKVLEGSLDGLAEVEMARRGARRARTGDA